MSRFYVGQPVVCVNTKWGSFWYSPWAVGLAKPVKGQKYHVRSYIDGPPPISITVVEIKNPQVRWSDGVKREAGFAEFRFAPITEEQVRGIIEEATRIPTCREHERVTEDAT